MNERYRLTIDEGTDNAFTKEYTKEELEQKKDYIADSYAGRFKIDVVQDADLNNIDDAQTYTVKIGPDWQKAYTGADLKTKLDYLNSTYAGRYTVESSSSFNDMSTLFPPSAKEQLDTFRAEHGAFMNDFETRDATETKEATAYSMRGSFRPAKEGDITGEERAQYQDLLKQEEALKQAYYTSDEYLSMQGEKALQLAHMRDQITKDRLAHAQANPVIAQEGLFKINPYAVRGGNADAEQDMFETASRIMNETIKLNNAPSRYENTGFANFFKGAGDKATDVALWTAGLSEITDNLNVRGVLASVQNKLGNLNDLSEEKIEEILTPAEKAVLQAWAINAQTQIERAEDLSRGYQAGQGAVESLGFMAEFALTGGVGKAATEGTEAMAKWLGKKALTRFGGMADEVAEKAVKEFGEKVASNMVGKYTKNLGLSLAEAAGRTAVMPSTFRNITEKATEIETDENGNNYLVSMNDAFAKGLADSFIENLSEGGRVNALGELVGDIAGKIPAYAKIVDKFSHTKVGELYEALQGSGIMNTLRAGGWHGIGEEYLEEWYGNTLRTLTGVDKEALKEFATVDNQIVTISSFLPMTIFGGTVSTAQVLSANKDLTRKAEALKSALMERGYDEDQANNMIDMMRGATPAEVSNMLSPIVTAVAGKNVNEAAALMRPVGEFAKSLIKWQSFGTKYNYQEQDQRDAWFNNMNETLGKFWQDSEDGQRRVQRGVNAKGEVAYLLGKPSAEDPGATVAAVNANGEHIFVNPSDYQLEDELDMNDFLGNEIMAEKRNKEQARMVEEREAKIAQIRQQVAPGLPLNIGTEEAPVQAVVMQVTADGAIVTTGDQQARLLSWDELGNVVGINAKPMTDEQLDEAESETILAQQDQRDAELDEEYGNVEQADAEVTEAEADVEAMEEAANPLPTKADGSVDQTALWNTDPVRWAKWNDEQRQDGGANSLGYINGAIAKESAALAEMQAAYEAEADFDARDAMEAEINKKKDRLNQLTTLQNQYVAAQQAAASAVEEAPVQEETVAPRVSQQMSEEEKAQMDAQHQARLEKAKSTAAKREAMQAYVNEISQGSVPMTLISMDGYEQVMKDAGCTPNQIAQVRFALEEAKNNNESVPAFYVPRVGIFAFIENIPNIEQLRLTYIHERQHRLTSANNLYLNAILQLNLSQERLAEIVVALSGSHFYDQFDDITLADEIISYAMERAYTYEDFSVALQELGIEQEIIDIITELDNEQRSDNTTYSSRRGGRYDLHDYSSEQGNRAENDRNPEAVSGGLLGSQGNRSIPSGRRGTEGGEGAEVISEEQLDAPFSGDPSQITAADGEVIADTNGKGGVRFSIRTWREGGRDYLAAWLDNDKTLTDEEKADILARMDEFYENAQKYTDAYAPFGTWSEAAVRYDNNGNPLMSVIKANGDYSMNLDFSLVCKKRRPLNRLLRTLINRNAFGTYSLKEREIAEINWILQEHGFEVACALCFVDSKRYRVTGVADVFAALYNKLVKTLAPAGAAISHFNYSNNPNVEVIENGIDTLADDQLNWEAFERYAAGFKEGSVESKVAQLLRENPSQRRLVDATDFIEAEGFEAVKANNQELLKLYNSKKGTGGPKASFGDVQYLNDILKKEKNFDVAKAYAVGGVRIQSFSDFVPHMYFDYMQLFAELAAKKLPAHAYTKEVLFAKIFGLTGLKINLSLVPAVVEGGVAPGLDAEGNYAWADAVRDTDGNIIQQAQSFPFDEAMAIQNAEGYSKNCGAIAVGISDEHIEKMLDDPNIQFIIPYHKSSLNAIVARMTNIDQYKDYTNVQTTKKASGTKLDKGTKDFNFNEYLHNLGENGTPQQAAQAYLDWCKENNFRPKFSQFAYHPNYYKLLVDFNTVDTTTGQYTPQGAVTMTFPTEQNAFGNVETLIEQGLGEDAQLEEKMEAEIDQIADEVESRLAEIAQEPNLSEKQQLKRMAELADERAAQIKARAEGTLDLVEEAQKAEDRHVMMRVIGEVGAQRMDAAVEATTLMDNLAVAREMEEAGKDAKTIKMATGWERGADNKWRLEMEDFEFKAKPGKKKTFKLGELIADEALFAAYPELANVKVKYTKLGKTKGGQVDTEDGVSVIKINEDQYKAQNPVILKAIEDFQKNHPEIAEIVQQRRQFSMTPEQKEVYVNELKKVFLENEPYINELGGKGTLIHEIQHIIQHIEGFAQGGNSSMTDTTDPAVREEVETLERVLNIEIDNANDLVPVLKDIFARGKAAELAGDRQTALALRTEYDQKRAEWDNHSANINAIKKDLRKFKALGYEGYRKLAGEVEARNAEQRMNMPYEERRSTLLSETEDVAREDQIFLRDNLMMKSDEYKASQELVPGHKKGEPMLSNTDMLSDVSFRISKNTKATIEGWCDKAGLEAEAKKTFVEYVDETFNDTTEQLCAAKWYLNGEINLPAEDVYKVRDAVKVAKKNKVDALLYDSPMDIIYQFGKPSEKQKPINPDTVPTLTNKKEVPGTDIVIYNVEEGEESRKNMREIINTHYGKNASPWCLLQGNEFGELTPEAKERWDYYSAYPKQVAFKGGRLLAFSANSAKNVVWWDRLDKPYEGIPVMEKLNDEANRRATSVINPKTGKQIRVADVHSRTETDGYAIIRNWDGVDGPMLSAQKRKGDALIAQFNRYTKEDFATDVQYWFAGRPNGIDQVYTQDKTINFSPNGTLETYSVEGYRLAYNRHGRATWLITTKGSVIQEYGFNRSGKLVSFFSGKELITDRKRLAEVEVPDEYKALVGRNPKSFMAEAEQLIIEAGLAEAYEEGAVSFRITSEQDKAYMEAVNAGDMETAQRMVLEAAKLAMPNTKVVDKHGNPKIVMHLSSDEFTKFGEGINTNVVHSLGFFTDELEGLKDYHDKFFPEGFAYKCFLNFENPNVVDFKGQPYWSYKDESTGEELTTDLVAARTKREGKHDGLIMLNVGDELAGNIGDDINDFVPFFPSQIKSAEPVTYDDEGNVIPLSERFNPENPDIRFRFTPRTDEQKAKLFEDAKAHYGVTNNFNAAGYMLPDGSLLDFSEANDGGDPNSRSLDHRDIEGVIMDNGVEYDSRWMYIADFMNEGAIRLLPESAGINMIQAPTEEQRKKIFDFIYKYNGEVILEINDERLNSIVYMEYDRRTSPSRIFRDIDGYFNDGIIPQQDVRFRVANDNQAIFVSNAAKAVEGIQMGKATPEQWLKMIEKNGGLKAGEDKWMGLSDWLKASEAKTLTKQEVLDFINENMIRIEETHYLQYAEEAAADSHREIVDKLQEKFNAYVAEYHEQNPDADEYGDPAGQYAIEKLREEMEDTFPYTIELVYGNEVYVTFDYEDMEEMEKWSQKLGVGYDPQYQINETRLNYTTGGLRNKHEIALTVPTFESWKKEDEIHFGDAGGGRAVAWIRFGDAILRDTESQAEMDAISKEIEAYPGSVIDEGWKDLMKRRSEAIERGTKAKVLVIDEIQSKRHQEGRQKGYFNDELVKRHDRAEELGRNFRHYLIKKHKLDRWASYTDILNSGKLTESEQADFQAMWDEINASRPGSIPDAPFERNWQELAMKRMLRYAAENGYDYVAWTKGDQQAQRYGLSRDVTKITTGAPTSNGERIVNVYYRDEYNDYKNFVVNADGKITRGDYEGSSLAEILGKEMALQIMSATESTELKGEGLKIGGEGMRGFYDKMLPSFMNKYGKKWGVKVEDLELPNLGKSGYTMHSVPVTEEMKTSVMEGQVMFRTTSAQSELTNDEKRIINEYFPGAFEVEVEDVIEDDDIRYRVVTDPAKIEELENGEKIKVYRAMQVIDGKLYPPMSAMVDGVLREPIELGQWEEAEERPDLADNKGYFKLNKGNKKSLKARYNPYFHTSYTPLNDQFSEAQDRPNLVTVEVEIPVSELSSGYKAEKAKDSVGEKEWKAGVIQGKLSGTRKVILSRWDKPVRIVPDSEVADVIVKMFEGKDITMPSNVVTPSLRAELEKRGVPFVDTDNRGNIVPQNGNERRGASQSAMNLERNLAQTSETVGATSSTTNVPILSEESSEEVSLRIGTPTEEVVAEGVNLSKKDLANLAGDIFAALPEESRKKITDSLNGNLLGLQDAIMQIPVDLAIKENWNDEDKAVADIIAEQMTKAVGKEMTRPFSAPEALWTLYNAVNKSTDLVSEASRALVRRNLGFGPETLEMENQAREDVRFRTVNNASLNASTNMYNKGARNAWTRLKESFVDMNASVEEFVKSIEKASGKVAQGFENILLALNQQSSKGLAAMESYEQKFLKPMFDEIIDIMKRTGAKYETVVRYVILKHGLERNKKLAQRDAKAHYQEIYDDIIAKIKSMTDAQKRTYLTNAQLQEADAKAELARLKNIDQSTLSDEDKINLKKEIKKAAKAVAEAEEHLKKAKKVQSMSEQDALDELQKIFDKIENGSDSYYQELRENDYSGLTSMFYSQLGVDRKDYETEEEYQEALMAAKQDKYSTLAEVEAAAEAEVEDFENLTSTKELWKRINAATKETLRQQYQANMISKDQYESLRDMFEFYVPLRGFADNTAEDMYTYYRKPNTSGYTKPILGAEGRKTEAESPFGWIAAMAGSAIASNVKNEAKLALYYFVSNRPDNGIATISRTWFVQTGVDADGRKIFTPAYPEFDESLSSEEAKQKLEDWQENMRKLRDQGQAYESGQRLNLGNTVVNIDEKNKPEHIVTVKVAGKDYTIIINGNPRAAQAINGDLNVETDSDYQSIFGPVLRWMSSVNTSYNPEFWATNMMRDMAFTFMSVNIKEDAAYRRKFAKNYAKAFKVIKMVYQNENGTIGDSYLEDMYKEFVANGGVTGYTQIKDSETWENEIKKYIESNNSEERMMGIAGKKMMNGLHYLHQFGESLEQVSRFAAFLTSREMGKSMSEAINDAKEITVNFNRKGSGKRITLEEARHLTNSKGQPLNKFQQLLVSGLSYISPLGRRFFMFFNASIQGLNATYKLWKKNKTRAIGWALGYAAVGLMNALIHALMDDDDDYLDIPQYERRNSLMLGGNGVYFKWALPQEARAFYALGDLAVETVMGRNPHQNAVAEAAKIMTEVLPINPAEGWKAFIPSAILPGVELLMNEDYKGAPIYNEQKWLSKEEEERTARWAKAYQGTGKLYIWTAQALNSITGGDEYNAGLVNLQPEKIEHIVQSAFGGTIRTADKFVNTVIAAIDPEEDVTARQFPFLNRFLTVNDERFKNVHVNDVYDYYAAEAEHAITLGKKYTKAKDKEAYDKLLKSDEYKWAQIYTKYKKPIKKYQDAIKVADTTAERMELMKQQDELKKRMIKEISEL